MKFIAVDTGTHFHVSENGIEADSYKYREQGKRAGSTRYGKDFISLVRAQFENGIDVVTEAPTVGSFRMRNRHDELEKLLSEFPERTLWTINSHAARNEARRQGWEKKSEGGLPNELAAALIWQVFNRNGGRAWRRPDHSEDIRTTDPVRPNRDKFVSLRNDEYPKDRMDTEIYVYLPAYNTLTADQQQHFGDGRNYYHDRAAAFVVSLMEPSASSRKGWERIIGSSSSARGSVYRQVLVTGKPSKNYQYGFHYSGLTQTAAARARRNLRTRVLKEFPGIR